MRSCCCGGRRGLRGGGWDSLGDTAGGAACPGRGGGCLGPGCAVKAVAMAPGWHSYNATQDARHG